ncbi:MAG TPA: type II toxin-antitoxin system death-on-curing family toxin [Fimbriimonadaceae bacterium]
MTFEPIFLTVDQVLTLHHRAIVAYGGGAGLLNANLLESAVMSPQATFGGAYLNETLEQFAAAYWLSLTVNHPFADGNKRTALAACSTFLRMNGYYLDVSEIEAELITLALADGTIKDKKELLKRFSISAISN